MSPTFAGVAVFVVGLVAWRVFEWWDERPPRLCADPAVIARLEYELGYSDEPPLEFGPGVVISYRPENGIPGWFDSDYDFELIDR